MSLGEAISKLKSSFRFRLFVFFTIAILLITFFFSTIYIHTEIRAQQQLVEERANLLAQRIAELVRLPLFAENADGIRQIVDSETTIHKDIASVIISTDDKRILNTFMRPDMPEQDNILLTTVNVTSHPLSLDPQSALVGETSTSTPIGSLALGLDITSLKEKRQELLISASLGAFIFWLVISTAGYLLLGSITKSFQTLMNGLNSMAGGNFNVHIPVNRDDETGQATRAVNRLAQSLYEREQENMRLQEELINAMRLEVQEEKKQMMAKLIQTNRMTFLGLLASSMAHEINNPNASIRLAGLFLTRVWGDAIPLLQQVARDEGDFILGGIPFTAAQNEILQSCANIERSTEKISHVVQDLRTYSLGESCEFMPNVSINKIVHDSISIIRAYGRYPDINISVQTADNIPVINGNKNQLEQVVVNLLLNAMQAMAENKGTIAVRTAHNSSANKVLIAIKDEGEGIPEENLAHLTEPFFSTRISKGGSGLGLFVANHIINEHQGTLKFISKPGEGTTASILLPVYTI